MIVDRVLPSTNRTGRAVDRDTRTLRRIREEFPSLIGTRNDRYYGDLVARNASGGRAPLWSSSDHGLTQTGPLPPPPMVVVFQFP
jgi:hypothetical protein